MITTVTDEFTQVGNLVTNSLDVLSIQVKNLGSQALDAFEVRFRVSREGDFFTIFSETTDWTTPSGNSFITCVVSNTENLDITALDTNESILFYLERITGFYEVSLWAKTASGTTQLETFIGGGNT